MNCSILGTQYKRPIWEQMLTFGQHTDIAFYAVSVLFYVIFFSWRKIPYTVKTAVPSILQSA